MSRLYWTKEQIDDIINKYQNGTSQTQLAKDNSCSRTAINTILKNNNIHIRNIKEANGIIIPEETVLKIIDEYVLNKKSIYALKQEFNLSQDKIESLLKEHQVKLRTYAEAKDLSRKYNIDDNFFKNQNHNMAYLLGFIAADGNISTKENRISIELHEKDRQLLEDFRAITQNSRPLKKYLHKHEEYADTPAVKFETWSAEWKKDLAIYNITPNKTFTLQPPTFLNKDYYISYIKGYFDGDGSIYFHTNTNKYTVIISGASKELIYWMRNILLNQYGIVGGYHIELTKKGHEMYVLTYSSKEAVFKFYEFWYKKDTSTICLNRKKEIFENAITFYKK